MNQLTKFLALALTLCLLFNLVSLAKLYTMNSATNFSRKMERTSLGVENITNDSLLAEIQNEHPSTMRTSALLPQPHSTRAKSTLKKQHHRLAVIVPFREATKELKAFVPHMHRFLAAQQINFTIFLVSQRDGHRFNRGALLNVGVKELDPASYDYVVLHDVDLLPVPSHLSYRWAPHPVHISPPSMHPKYHFRKFAGGIVQVPLELYHRVNGFSSAFWGWGKEDLDFAERLQHHHDPLQPLRRPRRSSKRTVFFRHLHDEDRERDKGRRRAFRGVNPNRFGLNATTYQLLSRKQQSIANFSYILLDVKLACNLTPMRLCN